MTLELRHVLNLKAQITNKFVCVCLCGKGLESSMANSVDPDQITPI